MRYLLTAPAQLLTEVPLPSSKSISNRALVMHALAHGTQMPLNLSDCDDTRVMTEALARMPECIDIHAAGTAMRFLTAYLSVTPGTHTLTGTARMRQRPIRPLVDALRSLGAQIDYAEEEGFPPLHITGATLCGQEVTLPGNISSQYISALLMIAPTLPQGLHISLTGNILSKPYIDLTLGMMRQFGVTARWTDAHTIAVKHGTYRDTPFSVEADWSAASYWYEMVALSPDPQASVCLKGLLPDSLQGDSQGVNIFARLGVETIFTSQGATLRKAHTPTDTYIEVSLADMPDLAQTFVVTCCLTDTPFRFTGLQSLRIKETDRMTALTNELHKLGYVLTAEGDNALSWNRHYCQPQPTPVIATYDDHRMAMAFAPSCLKGTDIRIANPEVVTKSYPQYWDHLANAGFGLRKEEDHS